MTKPNPIWLFRMTHVDNLPHILQHGLVVASSPNADPNFRAIGDRSLIGVRKDLEVPIAPGGMFSEYVPFYLGPRSPMLYQIATGYEGVEKIQQEEIIYLVVKHDCIVEKGLAFVFTDGHARHNMTQFFNTADGFEQLDWDTIYAEQWMNTLEDPDRQRRKQTEYMVKGHVPRDCFAIVLVYNEISQQKVESLLAEAGLEIPVNVSKKAYYAHL